MPSPYPYSRESDLRSYAQLSPEHQAYDEQFERSPGNLRELNSEILRQRDPALRQQLEDYRSGLLNGQAAPGRGLAGPSDRAFSQQPVAPEPAPVARAAPPAPPAPPAATAAAPQRITNLNELRAWMGADWKGQSDESMLSAFAKHAKMDDLQVANMLGYDPGDESLTSKRVSSGVDSFQSQLYSTGEALTRAAGATGLADNLDERRQNNRYRADVASGRARLLGGVDSYKDVDGIRSGANYVGGLLAQTAPQLALQAGVAIATGGTSIPAQLAAQAAAMYPVNLGDVLDNQRDQSGGKTDLLSASALAVPYTLADSLTGLGGKVAGLGRRGAAKEAELAAAKAGRFDGMDGFKGYAARGAYNGAKTSLSEGAGETFQEGMNQLGRMAVDPTQAFYDDSVDENGDPTARNSSSRFGESFVGGAALGGAVGGATGMGRRRLAEPKVPETTGQSTDLLGTAPPAPVDPAGPTSAYPRSELALRPDRPLATQPLPESPVTELDRPTIRPYADQTQLLETAGANNTQTQSDPGVMNVTSGGTAAPMSQLSGQQYNMFDGADTFGAAEPGAGEVQEDGGAMQPRDPHQQDLFRTPSFIQQMLTRATKQPVDGFAVKLSMDLAPVLGDSPAAAQMLDVHAADVSKKLESLNKKVSGDSNLMDPQQYTQKRQVLESRLKTLDAARALVDEAAPARTVNADGQRLLPGMGREGQQAAPATPAEPPDSRKTSQGALFTAQGNPTKTALVPTSKAAAPTEGGSLRSVTPATKQSVAAAPTTQESTPNVSVPDVPGRAAGKRRAAASPVAGGSVADPGSDTSAAVAVADPARGVAADDGAAGVRADQATPAPAPAVDYLSVNDNLTAEFDTATSTFEVASTELESARTEDDGSKPATRRIEKAKKEYAKTSAASKQTFDALMAHRGERLEAEPAPAPASKTPVLLGDTSPEPVQKPQKIKQVAPPAAAPAAAPAPAPKPARLATFEAVLVDAKSELVDAQARARTVSPGRRGYTEAANALLAADKAVQTAQKRYDNAKAASGMATAPVAAPAPAEQTRKSAGKFAGAPADKTDAAASGVDDLNKALAEYNKPSKGTGVLQSQEHETSVLDAVSYIRQVAGDSQENDATRSHAQTLLADEIDPKDVEKSTTRDEQTKVGRAARWSDSGAAVAPEQRLSQNLLESLVARIPGAPSVQVVDNPNSIPGVQVSAGVTPSGGVVGGQIYLFRDNIADKTDAIRTIFHELFHYGLNKVLSKQAYIQTMLRLRNTDAKVREYAVRWEKSADGVGRKGTMPMNDWHALATEEALADVAEDIKAGNPTLARKVANWMATVADALGMKQIAGQIRGMKRSEAEKFVLQALDAAVSGKTDQSAGERYSSDRKESSAFRKWFGDSKVVDAEGRPLVVYHGSPVDISEFKSAADQNDGIQTGIYFTTDSGLADVYAAGGDADGGATYPVYLSIKNPLDLNKRFPTGTWQGRLAALVSPRLTKQALAADKLKDGLSQSLISPKDRKRILDAGYDGLSAGGGIYIAFNPEQIKSATGNNGDYSRTNNDIRFSSSRAAANAAESPIEVPDPVRQPTLSRYYKAAVQPLRTRGGLGWLSNRQLGDQYTFVEPLTRLIGRMSSRAKQLMQEAHIVTQQWASLKPDASTLEMQRLMLELTRERMHVVDPKSDPAKLTMLEMDHALNAHLDKNDLDLQMRFRVLANRVRILPVEHRKVMLEAQAKLASDWAKRGELVRKRIVDAYEPVLGPMFGNPKTAERMLKAYGVESLTDLAGMTNTARKGAGDARSNDQIKLLSPEVRRAVRTLWSDLDDHADRIAQLRGPYFPMARFGDHVVVLKSLRFTQANDELNRLSTELQSLLQSEPETVDDSAALDKQIIEAKKAVRDQNRVVEKYKENPTDYDVEFHEARGDALGRVEQLKKWIGSDPRLKDMQAYHQKRTDYSAQLDSVSPAFMERLQTTLTANLPDKDAAAVRNAVRDLYITSMPERSAMKQQLKRLNVSGVKSSEMMRAFASTALKNAWHLSRLEFNKEIHEGINELRLSRDETEKDVGSEMAKRFAQSMTYDTGNLFLDRAANLSYLSYLALSPSFLVTNMLQPMVISLPIMASRHGVATSFGTLRRATVEVGAAMNSALRKDGFRFTLDLTKFGKDEAAMLGELFNQGQIDVTLEHDVGAIASGKEQTSFGKVVELAGWPAHQTETLNRVATALAAFRLERTKTGGLGSAIRYAEKVVSDTHLDYTPENAPRLMASNSLGGLGRIVFQFKRYMQGMIYLTVNTGIKAFKGDTESMKAFAYLMGMQLAVAGSTGLPVLPQIFGVVAGAFNLVSPPDEDENYGEIFYAGVKDTVPEPVARALKSGIPAAFGVNTSGSMGMGKLFNPVGYANTQGKEGGDLVAAYLMALAGPAPSMVANWMQGASTALQGDPVKGAALAMPKVISNSIRAYDMADRGVTNRKGDVLLSPEELGMTGVLTKAFGFPPTDVSEMQDTRGAFFQAKMARDSARKRLMNQFVRETNERSDVSDVLEKINAFNARHPDVPIKPKDRLSALASDRKAQRLTRSGITLTPKDRSLAEPLGVQ